PILHFPLNATSFPAKDRAQASHMFSFCCPNLRFSSIRQTPICPKHHETIKLPTRLTAGSVGANITNIKLPNSNTSASNGSSN
ncbi:MAG: hypothetical protein KDC09_16355, partial [Bacteroidales bacterium]|nr:hypothetical protein [Bacteroidales bacterium]